MNICIGIISYLPDDDVSRSVRISRLQSLLDQLNSHFNLPVIIIAQNWKEFKVDTDNIAVYYYDKLGITGARQTLRRHFLESMYDYMIMFDDDMELSDNQEDYDKYIKTVESTKKEYYYVLNFFNNFSCISKEGFRKVDYDSSVNPEQGTGYEDWIFNEKCLSTLNSMGLNSSLPKYKRSHFLNDKYSTWNTGDRSLTTSNDTVSLDIVRNIRKKKYI